MKNVISMNDVGLSSLVSHDSVITIIEICVIFILKKSFMSSRRSILRTGIFRNSVYRALEKLDLVVMVHLNVVGYIS